MDSLDGWVPWVDPFILADGLALDGWIPLGRMDLPGVFSLDTVNVIKALDHNAVINALN